MICLYNLVHVFVTLYTHAGASVWLRQSRICLQCRRPKLDPLKEDMATHFSILAWRIPWREEPSRLQSMGSQRVGHNEATNIFTFFHTHAEENPVFQKKVHLLRTCTHLGKFCTDSFSYCVAFSRSRILKQTNKNWTNASCLLGCWWKSKVWP